MTRGRLGRYLAWQIRDYLVERGIPTLIVTALLTIFAVQTVGAPAAAAMRSGGLAADALTGFMLALAPLATLIAVNGIVANDRRFSYFRFLFSKPVSVSRYYAQSFVICGVGTIAAGALFLVAYTVFIGPVGMHGPLLFVALYFLSFGGLGFFLSAVTRYDWMVLGIIWVSSILVRGFYPDESNHLLRILGAVLPPSHTLFLLAGSLVRGDPTPAEPMLWAAAYGAIAFFVGLVVIRYRPLAA